MDFPRGKFWTDVLDFLGRHSGIDAPRLHMGTFGNHGTRRDDGIALHHTIVHDDTAHTHQHIVLDGAPVHYGIVPYGYIVSNGGRRFLIGAMDDGPVLHIDLVAHFDKMDIATDHGIEPNTALIAHAHLAHNRGIFSDKTILAYFWGFAPDWFYNHKIGICFFTWKRISTALDVTIY